MLCITVTIEFTYFGSAMSDIDNHDGTRRKKPNHIKDNDIRIIDSKKIQLLSKIENVKGNRFIKSRPVENGVTSPNPTIVLQRECDTPNPNANNQNHTPTLLKKKEEDPPHGIITNSSFSGVTSSTNPLSLVTQMSESIGLVEGGMFTGDRIIEFLTDQTDFLVIGCLGTQGVGKSTLLSHLAGKFDEKSIFNIQTIDNMISCSHCTSNIDLYVSENRVLFLDTPPILSPSVMDKNNGQEFVSKKTGTVSSQIFVPSGHHSASSDLPPPDNPVEIYSLQVASFVLSVCHVVIMMQDWFFDPNIIRLLQTAEMLKPPLQTGFNDNDTTEYFPHLVLVQNKGKFSDFSRESVTLMQETYNQLFIRSQFHIRSGMGIANGCTINDFNSTTCGDTLNLYLLPDFENSDDKNTGVSFHSSYAYLMEKLKRDLYGVTKIPLTQANLTEKNWFQYSSQVWEIIKKSSFFMEYDKLLSSPP